MVLESFLQSKEIKTHALFICGLCLLYVFIAFFVSNLFFKEYASLATLFILALMLSPSLSHILANEEKMEVKEGLHHFFRNHKSTFKVYFFAFLGVFFGYLLVGNVFNYDSALNFQINFLKEQEGLSSELVSDFAEQRAVPTFDNFVGLVSTNVAVVLICFFMSLFYGAGAMFLINLNASIFAVFVTYLTNLASKSAAHAFSIFGVAIIYFIPELMAFLLASVAGAVLSEALVTEKYTSEEFKHVMQNCFIKMCLSILLVFIAGALEMYFSYGLMKTLIV